MATTEDPFTSILHLEDDLYTTAYTTGAADGAKAGKIEGRIFGLEKGFEKFAALGVLHGRSVVWGARLPRSSSSPKKGNQGGIEEELEKAIKKDGKGKVEDVSMPEKVKPTREGEEIPENVLPPLPSLSRLPPHITLLHSLTDLATFSTENSEEAVADLDDRYKRGQSKAKLVELLIKEPSSADKLSEFSNSEGRSERKTSVKVSGESVKNGDNMEDFGGSRLLR
jgi:hypothetical protein